LPAPRKPPIMTNRIGVEDVIAVHLQIESKLVLSKTEVIVEQ